VPLTSAHAVSIPAQSTPGDTLLRDHGKLGLDTCCRPAIKAAEQGYSCRAAHRLRLEQRFEKLKNGTNTARYLLPHGKPAVARRP